MMPAVSKTEETKDLKNRSRLMRRSIKAESNKTKESTDALVQAVRRSQRTEPYSGIFDGGDVIILRFEILYVCKCRQFSKNIMVNDSSIPEARSKGMRSVVKLKKFQRWTFAKSNKFIAQKFTNFLQPKLVVDTNLKSLMTTEKILQPNELSVLTYVN